MFKGSGLILLAGMLMLNAILLTFVAAYFKVEHFATEKLYNQRYYFVFLCLILFLTGLYIRYFRITNYDEINNKLNRLSGFRQKMYYVLGFIYILLSILSTLGYAFYKGGIVSGWWG